MSVKCNYCGAENQTGTMFCRSCGKKFDYSQRQPVPGSKPPQKRKSGWFRYFVFFTVLSGLVCAGVPLYYRLTDESVFPAMEPVSDEDVKEAYVLTDSIRNYRRSPRAERFSVSDTALNIILNRRMLPTLFSDMPSVKKIAVKPGENGSLTAWVSVNFFGFLNTVLQFRGTLALAERGSGQPPVLKFSAREAAVGNVSFPKPRKLASMLTKLTDNPFWKTHLAAVGRIVITNGNLILIMQTGTEKNGRAVLKDARARVCEKCGLPLVDGICPKICKKCRTEHLVRGKCPSCDKESALRPLSEQYAAFLKRLDFWESAPANKTYSVLNELDSSVPEDNAVIRKNLPAYLAYSLFAEDAVSAFAMPYVKNFILQENPSCAACGGSGRIEKEVPVKCEKCGGTGTYREEKQKKIRRWMIYGKSCANPNRVVRIETTFETVMCPHEKKTKNVKCPKCGGTGCGLTAEQAKTRSAEAGKAIRDEIGKKPASGEGAN